MNNSCYFQVRCVVITDVCQQTVQESAIHQEIILVAIMRTITLSVVTNVIIAHVTAALITE